MYRTVGEYRLHNTGGYAKRLCEKCGETNQNRFYEKRSGRCKNCHNKEQIARFRSYKKKAVEYKGGKCEICGYCKCQASLDFHHLDPKQKDPKWGLMRNWRFDKIKEELNKCVLVCSNCHGEIHYNNGV